MGESVKNGQHSICFYKGNKSYFSKKEEEEDCPNKEEEEEKLNKIQQEFLKILNTHNLSFLLGAGCSSLIEEKKEKEVGIPTMQGLADEFYNKKIKEANGIEVIFNQLNLNDNEQMKDNLEKLMEFLFAQRFVHETLYNENDENLKNIKMLIKSVQDFIFEKCNIEGREIIEIYKNFYRKLIYRDNNLAKINIFTTNYDLFNEKALDELGIIYANGFSGVVERFFNPAVFNYAFAEQMELSHNKWNVIDNFIYLYKLHGSINWVETENEQHLFKIKEIQSPDNSNENTAMIYPTPIKQNASFGSPYSDIFREFQKKLMKSNNVLVVVGYSFADEHINNIIYQALTIPTFRLVILGDREKDNYKKLSKLNDPRIWFIYGGENKVHYFKNFIEQILPDFQDEQIESQIEKIREIFYAQKGKND